MTREYELNTRIGAAIRAARLARGVTQDDLAQLLQVDRTMISRYERGVRTLSAPALLYIFQYLEYSLHVLDPEAAAQNADSLMVPAHEPVQRINQILEQRPDLIPMVEDMLDTLLTAEDTPEPKLPSWT